MEEGTTQFFHTQKTSGTDRCTWTLTTRLGQMLHIAEELFGKRDYSYTPIGVEFYDGENPMVWYPGNCKHVAIRLKASAENDGRQALYQLAHETVHLLSPTGGENANNLEEGVATWFSNHYIKSLGFKEILLCNERDRAYLCPLNLVKPFLDKDLCCVCRIRKCQPSFSEMGVADIRQEFCSLSEEDLKFLVEDFQR